MLKKYIKILIKHNELKIYLKATYAYLDVWKTFNSRKELLQFLNDYLNKQIVQGIAQKEGF